MKICITSYRGNMYSGGQGIYLYYLVRELAKLGHEVTVLVGPPYPDDMPWARVIKIENQNFYAVKKDWLPRPDPFAIFSPLNFYEFIATRFWIFPEMLAFSLRAYAKLIELHRAGERFDLIHDNQCLGWGHVLMKALGIPVIASIHHPLGMDRAADFEQTQGLIERARRVVFYPFIMQIAVARRMDLWISGSRDSAEAVANAFNMDRKKMRVIYDGVDDDVFTLKDGPAKVPRRLIFVGNTEDRKKGILYLMEAMSLLPPDVNLMIIDGCSKWKFFANMLLDKYQLRGRVDFRARIPAEVLADEYRKAEVAVVPSVYEGFGLPAAEAMACGVPVVSSDGGSLPEVIGPDGDGIIVPKKNGRALADAIMKLLDNPGLRAELGRRGHERVMKLFTWRQMAIATADVYREAIERKRHKTRRKNGSNRG
jgi:glycosyltransferase involved in cell wall biosynthesis